MWVSLILLALPGCGDRPAEEIASGSDGPAAAVEADPAELAAEIQRIDGYVERVDSVFQPLPLLRPTQETELRRFGSGDQLRVSRTLGVSGVLSGARIDELSGEGALRPLQDGGGFIIRRLDHSQPLVVPQLEELLEEIASRFQARLEELGAPRYRIEITSALRTAEDQERLRSVNLNAAVGESTHEFGTSVDLGYNGFAAPTEPAASADSPESIRPILQHYEAVALERVAGRRSAELKAVLGEVLLELQREGRVMVTLERLQPVFHITVAR